MAEDNDRRRSVSPHDRQHSPVHEDSRSNAGDSARENNNGNGKSSTGHHDHDHDHHNHNHNHHGHGHGHGQQDAQGDQRPVIFVNNLSGKVENRDLEEVFSKFGKLTKVSVMYDPHTRESRGFAFLDFETLEDAQNAVKNTTDIVLHGREIRAELAKRGRPRTPTPGRYYGNTNTKRQSRYGGGDSYPSYPSSRDYSRRSPDRDYRDSYRRRGPSPPPRDRYGPPSHGRDRDPYARDPYPSRGGGGGAGGYDRASPPPMHYDRRSPPRGYGGSRGYDRY